MCKTIFRTPLVALCCIALIGVAGFVRFGKLQTEPGVAAAVSNSAASIDPQGDQLSNGGTPFMSLGRSREASIDIAIARHIQQSQFQTDRYTRLEAIEALGEVQDPFVMLALRGLLDDPSVAVREEAVDSLGALGGADGITSLGYALSDQDSTVRELAIHALADLGGDDAVSALARTLNEPEPGLRLLAVEVLDDIGSETAILLLQQFLADENSVVRETVADSLAKK